MFELAVAPGRRSYNTGLNESQFDVVSTSIIYLLLLITFLLDKFYYLVSVQIFDLEVKRNVHIQDMSQKI
jgi:hypothetical protein